jgi:prepilin-type N-terminal cleavage/methylation domain-containing protein
MKNYLCLQSNRAFTLIELLVVISLIAILTSLVFSAFKGVTTRARNLEALTAIKAVTTSIQNYSSDYHRMPSRSDGNEEPVELSAGSPLLKVLLGDDESRLNPKHVAFLSDPKIGRNGAGGLVGTDGNLSLVDPWGTPYRIVMDVNGDGRVTNPDSLNEDTSIASQAPSWLPSSVIGYSAGADKKFGTHDDVVSWR